MQVEQCLTHGCNQGFGPPAPLSAGNGGEPQEGNGQPPAFRLDPGTYLQVIYPTGQSYVQDAYKDFPSTTPLSPKLPAHITGFSKKQDHDGEPTVYFTAPAAQR